MDTVRLTALKYLQSQLKSIQAGENGYNLTFNDVVLGPLDSQEAGRKRAMCGIVTGKEMAMTEYPLTMANLALMVEFRVVWNPGDRPSQEVAELVLGDIQRKVLEDLTLGGNAIDLKFTGCEIMLDIFSDKTIPGVANFELIYRYNTLDPRQPI